MTVPTISVILPVFNAVNYVGDAVESILRQSFSDFEVFVIDDGSTDDSLAIIEKATSSDRRCKVISRGNKGLVATCNEGIEMARGRYVFRMDGDDVAHSERFAKQIAYLDSHPECLALGTRVLLADQKLLPIVEMFAHVTHDAIDSANLRGASAICHPTAAIRRDALLSVGGYRAEFEWAEDLDLFLRLGEIGQVANLPEVLLTYRQHLQSVGHSKRELQVARAGRAVTAARQRRGLAPLAPAQSVTELGTLEDDGAVAANGYGSIAAVHRKWAWLALIGGNIGTARRHAMEAIRLEPLATGNLKLFGCVVRGH